MISVFNVTKDLSKLFNHQPAQGGNTMHQIKPEIMLIARDEANNIHFSNLKMRHRGNSYHLHASTGDTIHIFEESIALYALTINKINGTLGLNAYMQPEPSALNTFSLRSHKHIRRVLGAEWEKMTPESIVHELMDYLI
jgi:hypothetical protein